MSRIELGTATALVGAGVFSIHAVYVQHAGDLSGMREAHAGSVDHAQKLADADMLAGGLTLLAGGAVSLATGKVYPLILAAVAFFLVAGYYHATLAGTPVPAPTEGDGEA